MRCTSGRAYVPGMRDRPCNHGLVALAFHGHKARHVEHETPVHVCPYCDQLEAWPSHEEKEHQ